ncbi:hypothetical protein SHKM778_18990 [Streptomyces sp. KM77-8]|uniref:Carbamoyltransferase domain-containing protein n=1 Tax=Streptomyces haneummycinicus TaxID=3074435 RepID=A0AAT9HDP3_9ACTN
MTAAMKSTPSVVLGLCSYTHDSSAALLVDGELVGFVEEERLSEQKHTKLYPARAVGWLLDRAKLSAADVDAVAYNFQPARYLAESPAALRMALSPTTRDRGLARAHGFAKVALRTRRRLRVLGSQFPRPTSHRFCTTVLTSSRPSPPPAGRKPPYLWSTASVSGRPPPSPTATAFSAPASSPWKRSTTRPPRVRVRRRHRAPGLAAGDEEGTVMALAALGDPTSFRHLFTRAVRTTATGFRIDPGYFPTRTLTSGYPRTSRRFVAETCPERHPSEPLTDVHRDLAAALQERTEQVMVHLARRARVLTGSRRLCVGGGVATNCVSIGKIIEAGIFDEVFVPPAPGTPEPRSGQPSPCTSIGAALARSPALPAFATSAPPTRTSPSTSPLARPPSEDPGHRDCGFPRRPARPRHDRRTLPGRRRSRTACPG